MSNEMKTAIAGALVGAIATGIVSVGLFIAEKNTIAEKTVEVWAERFDSVDENMSLEQAIEAIYKDIQSLENENSNLVNKNTDLESTIDGLNNEINLLNGQININNENESVIESAKSLANSNEFIKAIDILNNVEQKTPEMEALINDYTKKYEDYIVKQANSLKSDGKLDEANELVQDALIVIPDSNKLKEKQEDIENSYPKYMTDVVPAYQHGGNDYKEYTVSNGGGTEYFAMGGVKYTNGMTFNADYNVFDDISWAVYNLEGKYESLKFIVCHVDGTYNGDNTSLQIFYYGNLYEEIPLSPDMNPISKTLDISGVKQLKIQLPASGSDNPWYGVGNPIIK